MLTLFTYIMGSLPTSMFYDSQLMESIQRETHDYMNGVNNLAIVSDRLTVWEQVEFSIPIILIDLNSTDVIHQVYQGYLLDLEKGGEVSEQVLEYRNADTKFIVLTTREHVEEIIKDLLEIGICHGLILTIDKDDIEKHILQDFCKGIGNNINKTAIRQQNCSTNVSFLHLPPHVKLENEKLSGAEGYMAQAMIDYLGFRVKYIDHNELGIGFFNPPSELLGQIFTGHSLLAVGTLYPSEYRWTEADFVYGFAYTSFRAAVPVAAGVDHPTWFVILVSELSTTVWVFLLIAWVVVSIISAIIMRKTKDSTQWPFYILALLIGASRPTKLGKIVSFSVALAGFIVTCHYLTMMSSKLTAPSPQAEMDTLKELAESGLRIKGPPTAAIVFDAIAKASPQDEAKQLISKRYEGTLETVVQAYSRIVEKRDFAFFRHGGNLIFNAEKTHADVHLMKESILSWPAVALLKKKSCFHRTFQLGYRNLTESGLGAKWFNDDTKVRPQSKNKGPKKLALKHIKGFLYLLAFGWIVSTFAFLCEIITFKWNSTTYVKKIRLN